MNELLLQVLLEGGTLAVFVIFVIYQARTGREERKELTDTMLKIVEADQSRVTSNVDQAFNALHEVNGSIVELTKANAGLSMVIAVHDSKMDDRYDEIIRTLERILNQ